MWQVFIKFCCYNNYYLPHTCSWTGFFHRILWVLVRILLGPTHGSAEHVPRLRIESAFSMGDFVVL